MAISKIEQYFLKLQALESQKQSPKTEEMQMFLLPDGKTQLYFRKSDSDEHIKERIAKYIAHTSKYVRDGYDLPEFIRTKNTRIDYE